MQLHDRRVELNVDKDHSRAVKNIRNNESEDVTLDIEKKKKRIIFSGTFEKSGWTKKY